MALSVLTQSLGRAKAGRAVHAAIVCQGAAANVTHTATATYLQVNAQGQVSGFIPAGVTSDTVAGNAFDGTSTVSYSYVVPNDTPSGSLALSANGLTVFSASGGGTIHIKLTPSGGSGRYYTKITSQTGNLTNYSVAQSPYDTAWLQSAIPAGQTGSTVINLQVSDDALSPATATLSLTVNYNTTIRLFGIDTASNTGNQPNAMVGNAFSHFLQATGGIGSGYSASVVSGTAPPGLSFVGMVQSGTPTTAGIYTFGVQVSDGTNTSATVTYTQTVLANANLPRPAANTGSGFYMNGNRMFDPGGASYTAHWMNVNHYDSAWKTWIQKTQANGVRVFMSPSVATSTVVQVIQDAVAANQFILYSVAGFVGISLTWTAGLAVAATAGTLTTPWIYSTGLYSIKFNTGEARTATLTNGSTAVTWSGGLSSAEPTTGSTVDSSPTSGSNSLFGIGVTANYLTTTIKTTAAWAALNNYGGVNVNEWGSSNSAAWKDAYAECTGTIGNISGTTLTLSDTANPFNSNVMALQYLYIKGAGGVADQCVRVIGTVGGSAGNWTIQLATAITGYTGGGVVGGGFGGILRKAGFTGVIVVDTGGSGQDYDDLVNYGPTVVKADSIGNTLLSYHLYGFTEPVEARITNLSKAGTAQVTYTWPADFARGNTGNPLANSLFYTDNLYIQGVTGMTAVNNQVGAAGGYTGVAGAWKSNFGVNTSTMVGTPAGGFVYSANDYRRGLARLAALGAQGAGVMVLEFGPSQPPLTEGGSATWVTAGQVITTCEKELLPWAYWALDDNTGGGGATNLGDYGAINYQTAGYSSTAQLTESGRDVLLNPFHGYQALSTPASFFVGGSPVVTPPSAPTSVTANAISSAQINLTWSGATPGSAAIASYTVQRALATGGPYTTIATGITGTAYNSTGLTQTTAYFYRIQTVDTAGNASGYSAVATATTQTGADTTPPTVPGTPSATPVSVSQNSLAWGASTDVTGGVTAYLLQKCTGVSCTPTGTPTVLPANLVTYIDSGLIATTTYGYALAARDAAGNVSAYTAPFYATTLTPGDTTPPAVPTNLVAVPQSATQVNAAWTGAVDAVGFTLQRCSGVGCTVFTPIAQVSVPAYLDTSVLPATSYTYKVDAQDAAGNVSAYSTPATVVTPAAPTPPAFTVNVTDVLLEVEEIERGKLQLRWQPRPFGSPVTPFRPSWTFDDPTMTFDNPEYTFDGSSPIFSEAVAAGTSFTPWTFDNPAMTFDNPQFTFDGLGPGTTIVESIVWINAVAVLTTVESEAVIEGLLVDTDYEVYVTSGFHGAPPVISVSSHYQYGSTELAYYSLPPGPVPAPDLPDDWPP